MAAAPKLRALQSLICSAEREEGRERVKRERVNGRRGSSMSKRRRSGVDETSRRILTKACLAPGPVALHFLVFLEQVKRGEDG